VTRGRLPQRAGLPSLNGGGAATSVPPPTKKLLIRKLLKYAKTKLHKTKACKGAFYAHPARRKIEPIRLQDQQRQTNK